MALKNIPASLTELIGLPYDRYDCWGICKLFYQKVLNVELLAWFDYPNLTDEVGSKNWAVESEKMVFNCMKYFAKVNEPQFGDLVLLKIYGHAAHIGIYIDRNWIMHTDKKNGCVLERTRKWEKAIEGYYRYDKI